MRSPVWGVHSPTGTPIFRVCFEDGGGTTRYNTREGCFGPLPRDTGVSIRTVDLTKRYKSGATGLVIFEKLNLQVDPGERVALVGESGAGKSTLLYLLGGLDRPTEGQIFFDDRDITGFGEPEMSAFR